MKKYTSLFLLIFVMVSCRNSASFEEKSVSADVEASPSHYKEVSGTQSKKSIVLQERHVSDGQSKSIALQERQVIWVANIEIQVEDIEKVSESLKKSLKKYGAFSSGVRQTNTHYESASTMTIRVNSAHFEDLIGEIKKYASFMRALEINSDDVTEEFVDVNSRLKTKREVRARYMDILKTRAGTIEEVLKAEDAIRKITEEIEAKEGRLRYLQNQVSLSTINLSMYEPVSYQEPPVLYEKSFIDKAVESLKDGWHIVVGFVLFLLNVWPLVLVIGFIFWKRKWLVGMFRRKKR